MHTKAKGEVLARTRTVNDELVSVLDSGLVTVARQVPHHDLLTLLDLFSTNFCILHGRAAQPGAEPHVEVPDAPEGKVMAVEFEVDGQPLVGFNGGPHFKFTEAISLMIGWAFDAGYRRVEWKCNALNEPSRIAALKPGKSSRK